MKHSCLCLAIALFNLVEHLAVKDIFFSVAEVPKLITFDINATEPIENRIKDYDSGGLSMRDLHLLGKYYSQSHSIFEFGVGKSTEVAALYDVSRYSGVDSSTDWLKSTAAKTPAHFRFYWADIGATKKWGFPVDNSGSSKYPFYSIGALAAEGKAFDFYMVDGRFRVACVIAAFLHASKHNMKPDRFLVGLHDFAERHVKNYAVVKNISTHVDGYDHSSHVEGVHLTVFRRKEGITDEYLTDLWLHYKDMAA